MLAELAGEARGAVAGEDAVVGLAGAAVVAGRGVPTQPAAAAHRAHRRAGRRGRCNGEKINALL